eukprot:scaffold27645_cov328-Amphora_coffeaeformis.AAC.1
MAGKGMELMEIFGCQDAVFYPKMNQLNLLVHQLRKETPYKPPRRCKQHVSETMCNALLTSAHWYYRYWLRN